MSSMTPCSFGSITLSTKTTWSLRKEIQLATCSVHKKFSRTSCSYGRCLWFRPISVMLLQNYSNYHRSEHISRLLPRATVDTDVTAEEHSAISSKPGDDLNEASGENLAVPSELDDNSNEASPTTSAVGDDTSASTSPATATPVQGTTMQERKRKIPRVKDSDLVVGATFTGTVRSIQPFGAFVDIGAYSNGLVHISNLSDEFVKDVASVVSVGQEVKVKITDVSREGGRIKISLTMRENAQKREYSSNVETKKPKSGNSRNKKPRNGEKMSRTSNKEKKVEGGTKLVIGEVLNGTVKKLNDSGAFISLPDGKEGFLPTTEVSNAGSVLGKTLLEVGLEVEVRILNANQNQPTLTMKKESIDNIYKSMDALSSKAFAVAFRQNKEIAAFLDEREKVKQQVQTAVSEEVRVAETLVPAEQTLEDASSESVSTGESLTAERGEKDSLTNSNSVEVSTSKETDKIDSLSTATTSSESDKIDSHSTTPTPSGLESALSVVESASEANTISVAASNSDTLDEATSQVTPVMKADDDTLPNPTSVGVATSSDIPDGPKHESSSAMHSDDQSISPKVTVPEDSVADEPMTLTSGNTVTSNPAISTVEDKIPEDNSTEAVITPVLVKKLREETGAGMMDCKNALSESGGDIAKAQEFLRKKGLASAEKRAGKVTAEGRIGSYIHDSRIGVLIEVNCETDFVSRGDIFKELVEDLAMQVAACPQVQYLVPEDVPEEVVNKEREIEMQKEDLMSKPEQFRERIVDGRINKRLQELALLEQPYIKNDKLVVKDWVKQAIATVGENIRVKQFVRFNLGEGLQKRSEDFAAEVAAQTVQKASTNPPEAPLEQQAEAKEDKEKVAAVAISAALVKQLRDETGAGMMDCKKALAESDGDLEKAQEYLRKKGVASAAKKSSRITAEGRISSYIHDTRIGALIEVNSETDFVARNERFKDLGKDLAMQVVACPQVQFVSVEDIPESVIANEREIEMQREDLQSKPENIREKIVDGRISKRLSELALLEQPFIKDDSLLVKDMVSQTVAALGENIKVRRFARFTLGK